MSAIVYKEKQDYPFEELISETGGSLGVFLGLSLWIGLSWFMIISLRLL